MKAKWIVISVLVVAACICLISMVATGSPLPVEAFRSGSAAIRFVVVALLGLLVFLVAVLLTATLGGRSSEKPEPPGQQFGMAPEAKEEETSDSAGSAAKQTEASHTVGVPSGTSTEVGGVGSEATDHETSEPSAVTPVGEPIDTTEATGATPERQGQQFGMAPEAKEEETSRSAGIAPGATAEEAGGSSSITPEETAYDAVETSRRGNDLLGDDYPVEPPVCASDLVHFSAFAPRVVRPGMSFLLDIWAYLGDQRADMLERAARKGGAVETGSKGPVRVPRDTDIVVLLHLPGFEIENDRDTLVWVGEIANVSFVLTPLAGLQPGDYVGTARLIQCGREAARLSFTLRVGDEEAAPAELPAEVHRVRSAFASYESSDRLRVLDVVRGMRTAGVDVFLDVLSLRTQDNWQERIPREIASRDRFCLFWSGAASRSKWVGWEWRCALEAIGCGRIQPVPLVDPSDVCPPAELRECAQFDDIARIAYDYYERRQRESGR